MGKTIITLSLILANPAPLISSLKKEVSAQITMIIFLPQWFYVSCVLEAGLLSFNLITYFSASIRYSWHLSHTASQCLSHPFFHFLCSSPYFVITVHESQLFYMLKSLQLILLTSLIFLHSYLLRIILCHIRKQHVPQCNTRWHYITPHHTTPHPNIPFLSFHFSLTSLGASGTMGMFQCDQYSHRRRSRQAGQKQRDTGKTRLNRPCVVGRVQIFYAIFKCDQ